jgi:hypothetical protein
MSLTQQYPFQIKLPPLWMENHMTLKFELLLLSFIDALARNESDSSITASLPYPISV